MPANKKKSKLIANPSRFKSPIMMVFMFVFVAIGTVYILRSFASGIPVYRTNPDYWRPRIAGCESGSGPTSSPNYQAVNSSGHTGAYQFDSGTWAGAIGPDLAVIYPRAVDAPPDVQDKAFNTLFARRGTQPWDASYSCWGPGSAPPEETAAPPAAPPPSGQNITIAGRVLADNKPLKGVKIEFCTTNGLFVYTGDDGRFSTELPRDTSYCVRVAGGIPDTYTLAQTNNNSEHATAGSYEYQRAGEDQYHNLWQLFSAEFSWDRPDDISFVFWYTHK